MTSLNNFKIRNLEKCLDDDPELDNAKLFTYLLRLEDKIIKLEKELLEIMQKLKDEERK